MEECVQAILAEGNALTIVRLRSRAEALAQNPQELKIIRRLLHQPTMALRQGLSTSSIDEPLILSDIEITLNASRCNCER